MPTKREREYYSAGFQDGVKMAQSQRATDLGGISPLLGRELGYEMALESRGLTPKKRPFGGGYPKRKRNYLHGISLLKLTARNHVSDIVTVN